MGYVGAMLLPAAPIHPILQAGWQAGGVRGARTCCASALCEGQVLAARLWAAAAPGGGRGHPLPRCHPRGVCGVLVPLPERSLLSRLRGIFVQFGSRRSEGCWELPPNLPGSF